MSKALEYAVFACWQRALGMEAASFWKALPTKRYSVQPGFWSGAEKERPAFKQTTNLQY